ncbi:hypothetical protein SEA_TORTELLINI_70 [Mycobacterium phage Tortellini]|uniref:Helix-turn-helix DNA binding domain protein n=1 Tax=Mycobacterium phage Tortellini TaxID=1897497 RepID=A0A1D8EXA0_9CAUD|nr:replication initiation protein [Mycobacterium phage Tortellini]AOT25815.1 hypothetical protein SEA_TORTELLINI_70 [Mycobacterium phage Tortellini]
MARATGKDHAEINLAIWGDDDWLDLTPPAQHLYFVLWTSPQLSYCGAGEWHAGRIAAMAKGWTAQAVEEAAAELSRELFLIIDTDTEEFLLRSWIKHDAIWKKPNMAVSMANARAALASRTLRGVVVHEVRKIKARNIAESKASPEVTEAAGWQRAAVRELLSQKAIDPSSLDPFTPSLTPDATLALTLGATPSATPGVTPTLTVRRGVGVNPPSNPGPTPAPAPYSSSNYSSGYVTGVRHQGAEPDPNTPPPRYCPKHMPSGTLEKCGGCAEARRVFDTWQAGLTAEQREAEQARARAEAAERAAAASARAMAIVNCELCDDDGYRDGRVCDHVDHSETNARGIAMVRAALGKDGDA